LRKAEGGAVDQSFVNRVIELLGPEGVVTDAVEREPYGHDEFATEEFHHLPALVVRPDTEEKVASVVKLCAEALVPVTARGGGTGLAGGCVPGVGGIVLSLERLNKVVSADAGAHTITLQAGVPLERIYKEAEAMGLFFPPHPGDESAMIGGIAATNAGGARAVKYGTIRRFVLGLQVVTADGEIVELGGRTFKSSTGYSLFHLMIGSEGTLGIITRVTLSLLPPPGSLQTMVVPFDSVQAAIDSVPEILQTGIIPFAVEFVEHSVLRVAERLVDKSWPVHQGKASLMIVLDGPDEDTVLALAERIAVTVEEKGAFDVLIADQRQNQADILEIRSLLYEALRPGTAEIYDVCVPRSEVAGHVSFVHELEAKYEVPLPTYGHAADGNVHTHSMRRWLKDGVFGEAIPDWEAKHQAVRADLYADAVRRGGLISGEHGIGLAKREFLEANIGKKNLGLMRAIKRALDPKNILNPGKVFSLD
jgi:glycolate oxidase